MTRDEIVTALREHAERSVGNEWGSSIFGLDDNLSEAADLIENQQRHIEALMKANDSMKDAIARRDKQIEDLNKGMAQLAKSVAVKEEKDNG